MTGAVMRGRPPRPSVMRSNSAGFAELQPVAWQPVGVRVDPPMVHKTRNGTIDVRVRATSYCSKRPSNRGSYPTHDTSAPIRSMICKQISRGRRSEVERRFDCRGASLW